MSSKQRMCPLPKLTLYWNCTSKQSTKDLNFMGKNKQRKKKKKYKFENKGIRQLKYKVFREINQFK